MPHQDFKGRRYLPRDKKDCIYYSVYDKDSSVPLFNFGKYRGKSVSKIYNTKEGKRYIEWILAQDFQPKGGTLLDNYAFNEPCLADAEVIETLEMVVWAISKEREEDLPWGTEEDSLDRPSYKSRLPVRLKDFFSADDWEDLTDDEKRKHAFNLRSQIKRLERKELGLTMQQSADKRRLDRYSIREDLDWS